MTCLFNFGREESVVEIAEAEAGAPMEGHGFAAAHEGSALRLPPYGAYFGAGE